MLGVPLGGIPLGGDAPVGFPGWAGAGGRWGADAHWPRTPAGSRAPPRRGHGLWVGGGCPLPWDSDTVTALPVSGRCPGCPPRLCPRAEGGRQLPPQLAVPPGLLLRVLHPEEDLGRGRGGCWHWGHRGGPQRAWRVRTGDIAPQGLQPGGLCSVWGGSAALPAPGGQCGGAQHPVAGWAQALGADPPCPPGGMQAVRPQGAAGLPPQHGGHQGPRPLHLQTEGQGQHLDRAARRGARECRGMHLCLGAALGPVPGTP